MAVWPDNLPQNFNTKNFTREARSQTIESETDIGPPKRRRRSSLDYQVIAGTMALTFSEEATLEDFWKNTTKNGIIPFLWDRLGAGEQKNYVFKSPPKFTYPGGYVKAELQFETY